MMMRRAIAVVAGVVCAASLWAGAVSAQSESATAEDGAPASEAPAETTAAPDVPLGANLTPPLGALPLGPAIITAPGSGQPGSSTVSMAPGTLTAGVASEGENAVRAPEAAPAPAPITEAAPAPAPVDTAVTESAEPVIADRAVATETDLDADNYADALELEVGLNPANPDTDGDSVADGDEVSLYSIDPFDPDTDDDGVSDGEELFARMTDPAVWDDFTAAASGDAALPQTTDTAPMVE